MPKMYNKFLIAVLMCFVTPFAVSANSTVDDIIEKINKANNIAELNNILYSVNDTLKDDPAFKCAVTTDLKEHEIKEEQAEEEPKPEPTPAPKKEETCDTKYANNATAKACCDARGTNAWDDNTSTCDCGDGNRWDKETNTCKNILEEKQEEYNKAKENEQSLANRTLTAATVAATGIGGMELAMGLSEQKADKDAANDMAAYIATFRCTYGDGKQVKAGMDEIELPGGNDATMMSLRNEYFTLAADLKERKTALGLKPGIESEEILDKSQMGLYDDENVGITGGTYESLYRAQMLNSEADQSKIDEMAAASKRRVIGGATAAGIGVVGGILGNSLINGKLHDKIEEAKEKKKSNIDTKKTISVLDKNNVIKTLTDSELTKILKDRGLTK